MRKTLSDRSCKLVAVIKEISSRLTFLDNVGLEYLTLSRASGTLSGGEVSGSDWQVKLVLV